MASYVGKTPARQAIVADNTITSAKIVDNTISTSDILDSTITGSDLASNIVIDTTGTITSGALTACGLSYPTTDGTSGQVIQTDGAGNLTFATVSGGGGDVVDDTTPQLGGNLDLNSFDITGTNICIDASGCLGIGNQAAPTSSYNIDIAASGTHGNIRLQRANVSNQYMLIGVSDGSRHDIQVYGDKALRIMNRATTQTLGIEFWTNSTCKMKIDGLGCVYLGSTQQSAGNVVGSTNTCTGMVFKCGGYIGISTSSECALILNRRTSDGDIAQFRKDGTEVGSIGVGGGYIHIGKGDTGIGFASDDIIPYNTDTPATRDNAIDLGGSGYRFKDLYLGGGLYVGGTGSANYLDDYEEGTWTPVYLGTSSNPTITYDGFTHGVYNKVGNVVFARGYIRTDSVSGGAGGLKLGGFPFFFPSQAYGATVLIQQIFSWGTAPVFTANDNISDMVNFYDSSGNILTTSALATGSNSNSMTILAVYQV